MPRLTISLPKTMHSRVSSLSVQHDDSLSNIINRLILIGMQHLDEKPVAATDHVEQHCQQLIIQMSALIKNMSAEILKFDRDDFERLRQAALGKHNELMRNIPQ